VEAHVLSADLLALCVRWRLVVAEWFRLGVVRTSQGALVPGFH